MMHRAWSSIVEVSYCFWRSYVKFQGHTALKIIEFDRNWAFPDCNSSLNSQMAMKWCTKLETAKERCPIVFQGHPSNFKVTRDKTSPILTQIGRFRTIGKSQLSNPSDLPCCRKGKRLNPCSLCSPVSRFFPYWWAAPMMSNHSLINIFVMKFDQIHIHRICICTYKCVLIPALVYGDLNELIGLGDVAVMRLTLVVIFKLKLKIFYILHFLLNCEIVNVTRLHWWLDNIGSTYGWVLLGVTRPLWVNWVDCCDCHF